jgi:hypothetical protein
LEQATRNGLTSWIVLEEVFGTDAFWDRPKIEAEKAEESETPVPPALVH